VILPVDQGFEHGPARSFAPNPRPTIRSIIFSSPSTPAATPMRPAGISGSRCAQFAGKVPLILKLNNHDVLQDDKDPNQAITGSVHDAMRLGCAAVGFTIYPGSVHRLEMYGQIRAIAEEAKAHGLAVSYGRIRAAPGFPRRVKQVSTLPVTQRRSPRSLARIS